MKWGILEWCGADLGGVGKLGWGRLEWNTVEWGRLEWNGVDGVGYIGLDCNEVELGRLVSGVEKSRLEWHVEKCLRVE